MKESGMNKLIKLLNEYDDLMVSWYEEYFSTEGLFVTNTGQCFREEFILSKRYGFIKWLVDNDKIGRNKNSDRSAMIDLMRAEVKEQTEVFEGTEKYEWYIMLLSIQDNPIEFLISILK